MTTAHHRRPRHDHHTDRFLIPCQDLAHGSGRHPLGWVITLALAALGVYLFATHTGHIVAALPYLLLLACPLMHLFMHGGHGHHHGKRE